MAEPFNLLIEKTEDALDQVITDLAISGYAVLKGSDDSTKTSPNIICEVVSIGEENPTLSGNFNVQAQVTVNTQAHSKNALTNHKTNSGKVFDELMKDNVETTLSGKVTDYHVIDVHFLGYGKENDETEFSSAILLDIYCCARDL